MAKFLVQSPIVPALVTSQKESGKLKSSVEMMCSLKTPGLKIRTFSGLRGSNSSDNTVSLGRHVCPKVAISASSWRARGPRAMFECFTEKAIKVIMLAQAEARRLGHDFIGTEHILLGLIGEGTGMAAKALKSMGINVEDVRLEVEKLIGRGIGLVDLEVVFTHRAKRVLELSLEEASQLGHNSIESEHLLLGLLREGEGVAAIVLKSLGADPSNIRSLVIRMVGEGNEVGVVTRGATSNTKMPIFKEYVDFDPWKLHLKENEVVQFFPL